MPGPLDARSVCRLGPWKQNDSGCLGPHDSEGLDPWGKIFLEAWALGSRIVLKGFVKALALGPRCFVKDRGRFGPKGATVANRSNPEP